MQEQGKISDLMKVLSLGSLYPFRSRSFQFRKNIRRNQNANAARLARGARDEPPSFKSEDHLMNGRRRYIKVTLHISLGRRTPVNLGVVMDKSEILALLSGKPVWHHGLFYPNIEDRHHNYNSATGPRNLFAIMGSGTQNPPQQALNTTSWLFPLKNWRKSIITAG